MSDMRHMDYLAAVADEDIRELRRKEDTYQGSWKRRGGIGAFMMMARKWDRIEGILSMDHTNPKQVGQYDVFAHIKADPLGADGTVLAEVRDLRRYLLLIEAEMMSRGIVGVPRLPQVEAEEVSTAPLMKKVIETLVPLASEIGGIHGRVGIVCPGARGVERPGTPEDGGHHGYEVLTRPAATIPERLEDGLVDVLANQQKSYRRVGGGGDDAWYIVDRANVPEDLWGHLPRLPIEQNYKEWSELQPEYQPLYEWHKAPAKWIMREEFREHWGNHP